MNASPSVLVSLVVSVLLCGSAACQREDALIDAEAGVAVSTERSTGEPRAEVYLLPFLNEAGAPVACISEFWPHGMEDECANEPGVPFKATLPLTLAIWREGTVIWRAPSGADEPEYLEASVPRETVSKLLAAIDLKEFTSPENVRYSDEAISWYCPASVIMVSKEGSRLFFCSQLPEMELLHEYWVWEGSEQRTFPTSKYSFDDFCKQLPDAYSRHLRQFAALRSQLKEILPATGQRIVLQERMLWTVVHSTGEGKR